MESLICVICEKEIKDLYPHNAEPVKKGPCCTRCNNTKVLPARLAAVYNYKPEKPKKKNGR
tara:strand:+ start:18942 stop:19124 length:183 start_codon:yes stop_codon:yes gene_type:complete